MLNCPIGTYKDGEGCTECAEGCADCENGYTCLTCKANYYLFSRACRSECPAGTFLHDNKICLACNYPCQTCSGHGEDQCNTCVNGKVYFNHRCVADCPEGTFFIDGSCLVCSPACKECTGTKDYCTSCRDG